MLLLTVLLTIILIKDPSIKCRSSVDKCGAKDPTTNLSMLRVSRYISVESSYRSYLISMERGSNKSLAVF